VSAVSPSLSRVWMWIPFPCVLRTIPAKRMVRYQFLPTVSLAGSLNGERVHSGRFKKGRLRILGGTWSPPKAALPLCPCTRPGMP